MKTEEIGTIIKNIAKAEILSRFNNLSEEDIRAKSPGDMVTIADIETEKKLTVKLKALYPSAIIGGEESIAHSPQLLKEIISAPLAFLIDPVDGTNNFIKGDERFALMMVALKKGMVIASWIYLPASDKMALCETGSGTMINGAPLVLKTPVTDCAQMVGAAHINRMPEDLRIQARQNFKKFKANKPAFCAGYDYFALLEGSKDFSAYYRTLPWDHLPGSHMLEQAGGYCRKLLCGGVYTIHDQSQGLLSASNEENWHRIRDNLFGDGL